MDKDELLAKLREAGLGEEALEKVERVLAELSEATWDTAYINNLPDSAFLHIAPGGKKDKEGKTMPRALRYFPVYDSSGKVDLPHLRNALARIPQSTIDQAAKDTAIAKAQALAKKNLPSYKEAEEAGDESHDELRRRLSGALRGRMGLPDNAEGPWVKDVYDAFLIYDLGGKTYQLDYSEDTNGNITIGEPTEVVAKTVYEPVSSEAEGDIIQGDFIPLEEKAIGSDGIAEIKIIKPGWGSSGFYSKEVLSRDAAIYKPGTKMYWDHPTESEDRERPERSLRDLAGELTSSGIYREDGLNGPGVYAKAKVFSPYKEVLEELAPHIGLSHRALGKAVQGEAEGKKGPIIEKLVASKSVDYVTTPGAGGKVVQLFEAARTKAQDNQDKAEADKEEAKRMDEIKELTEAKEALEKEKGDLASENARLKESAILKEAHDIMAEKVNTSELPEVTKTRLIETLGKNPPIKEGEIDREEFVKDIDEAIKSETDYIAKITESGKIKGMGSNAEGSSKLKESYKTKFLKEGKSEEEAEKMAETAVRGR